MRITIESTTKIVSANGIDCRVWEGETEQGVKVECLIPIIAARDGQDLTRFERDLREHRAPSPRTQAFPLRMIL